MPQHLLQRNGMWYYYRRVPGELQDLDKRRFIRVSLKTDSRSIALKRSVMVEQAVEEYWGNLRLHGSGEARKRYEAAVSLSRSFGFPYRQTSSLAAQEDISDLVLRVQSLERRGIDNTAVVSAILGGEKPAALTISEALNRFFELARDQTTGKNDDQIHKWRNPKLKAVRNFIEVIGNLPLDEIDRQAVLRFRSWWMDKIQTENLTHNSANKDFGHLSQIFCTVVDCLNLTIENPFRRIHLREEMQEERPPFPPEFVRTRLLQKKVMDGLNSQARLVFYLAMNTGCGLNEITGLMPEEIRIEDDIPHISIRPNKIRKLKTDYRIREIPLVGVSLWAAKQARDGFPRYAKRNASLSALLNKYLSSNDLLPSPNHSFYSLRHTFQDMLTEVEAPDRIQAELMGHKYIRPKYGKGPSLEQKLRWLEKIAFPEPV